MSMQRYGSVIHIKPEEIENYKRLHADVWPEVLQMIRSCHIQNYSIFLREPENLLFGYYEYHGTDHDADMAKMAKDAKTQEWWTVCKPMHLPFQSRDDGDWWAQMDPVFLMEK